MCSMRSQAKFLSKIHKDVPFFIVGTPFFGQKPIALQLQLLPP